MPSCQVPVGSWDGTPTGSEPGLDLRGPSTAPAGPETSPSCSRVFHYRRSAGAAWLGTSCLRRGEMAWPCHRIPSQPQHLPPAATPWRRSARQGRQAGHVGLQVLLTPLPAADQVDGRINSSLAYWRDLWCYWRRPVLALCGPEWPSRRGQ